MPRHGLFPGQHIASSPPSLVVTIGSYGGWGPLSKDKDRLRSGMNGGLGGFIRASEQFSTPDAMENTELACPIGRNFQTSMGI